jgi:hypothetical protein
MVLPADDLELVSLSNWPDPHDPEPLAEERFPLPVEEEAITVNALLLWALVIEFGAVLGIGGKLLIQTPEPLRRAGYECHPSVSHESIWRGMPKRLSK